MLTIRLADVDPLLLTRERGRRVAKTVPRAAEVVLDFEDVQAASPSFLDELLKALAEERGMRVAVSHLSGEIAANIERLRRVSPHRQILEIA